MKISDLQYSEVIYNIDNDVSDIIARLLYPQKYVQLDMDGVLFNLTIKSVDDEKFIVEIDGEVAEGQK